MKTKLFIVAALAATAAQAEFKIDRSVMSEEYWKIWNDDAQAKIDADIEKYRKADGAFEIDAPTPSSSARTSSTSTSSARRNAMPATRRCTERKARSSTPPRSRFTGARSSAFPASRASRRVRRTARRSGIPARTRRNSRTGGVHRPTPWSTTSSRVAAASTAIRSCGATTRG